MSDIVDNSAEVSSSSQNDHQSSISTPHFAKVLSGNKTVSVLCGNEVVNFRVNTADFRFHDFDCWIRSRFCISPSERLIFKTTSSDECMPGANFFDEENSIVIDRKTTSPLILSDAISLPAGVTAVKEDMSWEEDHHSFLLVLVAALAIYLYSQGVVSISSFVSWCEAVEDKLIVMGFFSKKGVALESLVSCVCWAIPYLFIRRMCNPETSKTALKKYSADAVFGGLAAGGTVLLKSMLFSSMTKR